jgi:hypothetical protein
VHHSSRAVSDPAYSSALAAANRFLHAWQNEDHEAGIVMLADSARQNLSQDSLQTFFSPGPDAAYEIAHGQRLKAGEYAFPLVLFSSWERKAEGKAEIKGPRHCKLVVIRDGKSDWAVEKLPSAHTPCPASAVSSVVCACHEWNSRHPHFELRRFHGNLDWH